MLYAKTNILYAKCNCKIFKNKIKSIYSHHLCKKGGRVEQEHIHIFV